MLTKILKIELDVIVFFFFLVGIKASIMIFKPYIFGVPQPFKGMHKSTPAKQAILEEQKHREMFPSQTSHLRNYPGVVSFLRAKSQQKVK
jgi:hypothetical protein